MPRTRALRARRALRPPTRRRPRVVAVVRLVTAIVYADEFHESYTGASSIAELQNGTACTVTFYDCSRLTSWSRLTTSIQATNTMLLAFTSLTMLGYNRVLGQALTMLFAMIADSASVLVVILVVGIGFGVASMPLLPSLIGTVDYDAVLAVRLAEERSQTPNRPSAPPVRAETGVLCWTDEEARPSRVGACGSTRRGQTSRFRRGPCPATATPLRTRSA